MSKPKFNETIVIDIQSDYVIVMDPGGKIHRLKRKDDMAVGDRIYYFADDRYEPERVNPSNVKRVNFRSLIGLAIMAALIFLFVNIAWPNGPIQPSVEAVLSIGTEEGIQVELGEKQEVLRVINRLGEDIDTNITLGDAFEETTAQLVQLVEISDNHDVLVAISSSDPEASALLETSLLEALELKQAESNIVVIKGDLEDYENALNNQTLLGDYQLANAGLELWSQEESRVLSAKEKQNYLSDQANYYQFSVEDEEVTQEWLKQLFNFPEIRALFNYLLQYNPLNDNLNEGTFDDSDTWYDSFYDTSPPPATNETPVYYDDDWDDDDWDEDDWDDDDWDEDDWDDDDWDEDDWDDYYDDLEDYYDDSDDWDDDDDD